MKKIILGLAVVAMAAATSAFTSQQPSIGNGLLEETWYFDPQETTNNVDLAGNYTRNKPQGVECGGSSETICSIQDLAEGSLDQPQLSKGNVSDDSADLYEKTQRTE